MKFNFWKQPELLLYKEDHFSKKMEKWMTKRYKLVNFDNDAVSLKIRDFADAISG